MLEENQISGGSPLETCRQLGTTQGPLVRCPPEEQTAEIREPDPGTGAAWRAYIAKTHHKEGKRAQTKKGRHYLYPSQKPPKQTERRRACSSPDNKLGHNKQLEPTRKGQVTRSSIRRADGDLKPTGRKNAPAPKIANAGPTQQTTSIWKTQKRAITRCQGSGQRPPLSPRNRGSNCERPLVLRRGHNRLFGGGANTKSRWTEKHSPE